MPRVVTITKTLYQFDELPTDKAKEKARDWYRELERQFCDLLDLSGDDFKRVAEILGVEFATLTERNTKGKTWTRDALYYSGFYCQGDGASFDGYYAYKADAPGEMRTYAPKDSTLHRIADDLQALQSKNAFQLTAKMKVSGHYVHSNCMAVDVARADDDDNYESPVAISDDDARDLSQCMRRFADWIYRQLEKEYEYLMSDESVDENIRINEYEFDETGKRDISGNG